MERSRLWLFLLSHRDISLLQTLVGFVAILPWTFAAEMMKNRIENVARVEMLAAVEAILKSGTRSAGTKLSSFGFDKKISSFFGKTQKSLDDFESFKRDMFSCFVFCPLWKRVTLVRVSAKWAKSVSFECSLEVGISTGVKICKVLLLFENRFHDKNAKTCLGKGWTNTDLCSRFELRRKKTSLSLSLSRPSTFESARAFSVESYERGRAEPSSASLRRSVESILLPSLNNFHSSAQPLPPSLTPLSLTQWVTFVNAPQTLDVAKKWERERVCGYIKEREREKEIV